MKIFSLDVRSIMWRLRGRKCIFSSKPYCDFMVVFQNVDPRKIFDAALNNIGSHDLAIYSQTDFLRMSFFSPNVSYCSAMLVVVGFGFVSVVNQRLCWLKSGTSSKQYWLQTCNTFEPCLSVIGTLLLTNPSHQHSIFKHGLVDSHLKSNPVASNQGWSVHSGM